MKKIFTLVLFTVFVLGATAQSYYQSQYIRTPRRNYVNLAYAMQDIKNEQGLKLDGYQWGAAAEFGSTHFLHRKPLAEMVWIGLDWSYLDAQYAYYKGMGYDYRLHFANVGMQFGPSVTVAPVDNINIKGYIHYAPSYAAIAGEDLEETVHGYVGYVTGGVQISFGFMTLGAEVRGGKGKFDQLRFDDQLSIDDLVSGRKWTAKLPSTRIIVGFRF